MKNVSSDSFTPVNSQQFEATLNSAAREGDAEILAELESVDVGGVHVAKPIGVMDH
jgi:hypothetical protein